MSSTSREVCEKAEQNLQQTTEPTNMPVTTKKPHPVAIVVVSGLSGLLFGIALEKGRVFEPTVIRDQMLMVRFVMLKMFLSAAATGMLAFSLLSVLTKTMLKFEVAVEEFASCIHKNSISGTALGGALLGCGVALAGSCPGAVFAQVGGGIPNAGVVIAGGLCGALVFAFMSPSVLRLFKMGRKFNCDFLHEYYDIPYMYLGIPFAAVLGLVIFVLEWNFPWQSEVDTASEAGGMMGMRAWPPYLVGALIGSLQIPIVLANHDTLGTATSYVTITAQILILKPLRKALAYLKNYRFGSENWWQVTFMCSGILGACVSANASRTFGSVAGVTAWQGFCGGFFMIYGSRLAAGCTSGHGLSGTGLFAPLSIVAVASMFGAGICASFLMRFFGVTGF